MEFADLSRIAVNVAGTHGVVSQRDDVYQDAMEKFYRYRVRTRLGAWLMAQSARNSLYRKEKRYSASGSLDYISNFDLEERMLIHERLEEMARKLPKAFVFMLEYINRRRHSGADRRMAHYYRRQLKAAVGV